MDYFDVMDLFDVVEVCSISDHIMCIVPFINDQPLDKQFGEECLPGCTEYGFHLHTAKA